MADPTGGPRRLRAYWLLLVGLCVFFLLVFALVEALGIDLLRDPSTHLERGGVFAAAVSFGLLVADVFIPVPSSVLMVGNGALFGVAAGTALSLAGSLGAAALGFVIGRRSGRLIERLVSPAEKARADALLARWGALAIVLTRPIPVLAETVSILAGASPLSWGRLLGATAAGAFPPCLLYALTGATTHSFGSGALAFVVVMAIAGGLYFLGTRARH